MFSKTVRIGFCFFSPKYKNTKFKKNLLGNIARKAWERGLLLPM